MSQITIQCRLVASPETRQFLWTLMAERNTPLINTLIKQLSQHPEFETWQRKGRVSSAVVSQLCQSLKTDPCFSGQPARLYASAEHVADYIYKSWLAIQKRLQQRLDGKVRWLEMLRNDEDLAQDSGVELSRIRDRANTILLKLQPSAADSATQTSSQQRKKRQEPKPSDRSLANQLFDRYQDAKSTLEQCAIAYLLKNGCKVPQQDEDPQKFAQRRRKVEIQVKRLQEQLECRIPQGRDLTGQRWLNTLETATHKVPRDNAEAKRWQDQLLTRPSLLPFPLIFETNEDLVWEKNPQGRLCVHFNGLRDYPFAIYCDQRQLAWFQRFLQDQQIKRASKNQHSSGLFTLRSARLAWQEGDGNGHPWDVHRLTLYCTVDTRLWSQEGTEQVRQEKAAEIQKKIDQMKAKENRSTTQETYLNRLQSTKKRIEVPFDRPSQRLYHGHPNIVVGISLGLEKPATLAVWDASTNQVLTYRSIRQLLGDNYALLNRQRQQQQQTAHLRHKAQKRSAPSHQGTSELGQYIDRLIAKAIIAIAQTYHAGSIAVAKLDNMRETIQIEIQAKAEQKCPGYVEGQKRYAKQYRATVHRWSYSRLIESIRSQALKVGIVVEQSKQPLQGTAQEKAKLVAIAAYTARS